MLRPNGVLSLVANIKMHLCRASCTQRSGKHLVSLATASMNLFVREVCILERNPNEYAPKLAVTCKVAHMPALLPRLPLKLEIKLVILWSHQLHHYRLFYHYTAARNTHWSHTGRTILYIINATSRRKNTNGRKKAQ